MRENYALNILGIWILLLGGNLKDKVILFERELTKFR